MRITITIVAILCFSAIEGSIKRQEFNVEAIKNELGKGAAKNDDLKKCVRAASFNALDLYDRFMVAVNRLKKRLKGVTDDLTKIEDCYHDKLLDETYLKWGQNYIDGTCLTTNLPDLAPGGDKEDKKDNTIYQIDRTIMSLTKELKKRGKGRDKAIQALACFRYKSTDALLKITTPQKTCFDTEISSASLDSDATYLALLVAKDTFDTKIKRFEISAPIQGSIDGCASAVAVGAKTFEKDEEHFTLSCLAGIEGFEDYGVMYNDVHVGFYLAVKKIAGDDVAVAQKLMPCYDAA